MCPGIVIPPPQHMHLPVHLLVQSPARLLVDVGHIDLVPLRGDRRAILLVSSRGMGICLGCAVCHSVRPATTSGMCVVTPGGGGGLEPAVAGYGPPPPASPSTTHPPKATPHPLPSDILMHCWQCWRCTLGGGLLFRQQDISRGRACHTLNILKHKQHQQWDLHPEHPSVIRSEKAWLHCDTLF